MTDNKDTAGGCCSAPQGGKGCCRIEALLGIDERGQMVLPKDIRERANIRTGDKLALVSWEMDGEVCCLTLIKADALARGVREFLGPVMGDLAG
jgi:antitoxin PrlF